MSNLGLVKTVVQRLPLILIPFEAAIFVLAKNYIRILTVEGSILFLTVWFLSKDSFAKPMAYKPKLSVGVLATVEGALLLGSIISLAFATSYIRPEIFFGLIVSYFLALFIEASETSTSSLPFALKLMMGQAVMALSFSMLYPGFAAIDSYRDYYISISILKNGGGLPKPFVDIIWYDFSPLASITYATQTLTTGLSVRHSELLSGFAFASVVLLATGALSQRVIKNVQVGLISMWLISVIPLIWVWASWPIPEMLALALSMLCFVVLSFGHSRSSVMVASLLVLGTIFVHGGMSLILLGAILLWYLLTRSRVVLGVGIFGFVSFLSYSLFSYVATIPYGFTTVYDFLRALAAPFSGLMASETQLSVSSWVGVSEAIVGSYWYILLAALCWGGVIFILNRRNDAPTRTAIFLISIISFSASIGFILLGSSTDAPRYIGLIGYATICIPAAVGVQSFVTASKARKMVIYIAMFVFIFTTVTSPYVAPDFWQSRGQASYAVQPRLYVTSTYADLAAQVYVNQFDQFPVVSNIRESFINLSHPCSSSIATYSYSSVLQQGFVLPDIKPDGTRISLFSTAAYALHYPLSSPYVLTNSVTTNTVYSSKSDSIAILPNATTSC